MFLLSVRCSVSCLLIIALTGLLQIINAESFRPIFNPNVALNPTAKKITAITTTTTTIRPLTTISATLKSRVSLTKHQAPSVSQKASRAPVKPLSSPVQAPARASDNTQLDTKDAPVAEALRGDWRRYYRRPYYYPGNSLLQQSSRYRRRPNPKPYYPPPGYNFNYPHEDYRFETDFLEQNPYVPKSKPKPPAIDTSKDYGIIDTDIGAFYDSQSATYNVPPLKNYDSQSSYYGTGSGSAGIGTGLGTGLSASFGTGGGKGLGGGVGVAYSDYGDTDEYKFSTPKPKTNYKSLPSRAPLKQTKTRNKYNYDDDYRYSSDTSGYATNSPEIEEVTTDANTVARYNNIYMPHHTIYQTSSQSKPKSKPKPKPRPSKTTTHAPPIKISDTSIDVLTKPLGSATFNLNLSPGSVYSPPSLNYNPSGPSYKPIQPIPLQPPATSYGVPIAPPLNAYTYNNAYQNQFAGYPPSIAQNSGSYVNPSSISITNNAPRAPGLFAEPPPINQQSLANIDVSYNSVQSSYDATPKNTRPTKRKPAAQTKVNSKRVSTKRPQLNTDEELAEDERNEQNNDYYGESYSFYKTMPQPSLPNTYDQEEFHTVKNKRKQPKQSSNYYYEREEKERTTKKPKQPIEVTLRIPDEDYLDDLVKVVQTTKRPKKKNKQTTSHVLDTEDLRDAYDTNSAYYPKKKSKSRPSNQQTTTDYDNYDDDTGDDDYDTDRLSNVNSKEDAKSSTDTESNGDSTQDSPYWEKASSIYKQYGIRARNDNFAVGSNYQVHEYNNGFRPIRNDQTNYYIASASNVRPTYVRDMASTVESKYTIGNRISSTLRSVTSTVRPTSIIVWDGGELPKNHKLA